MPVYVSSNVSTHTGYYKTLDAALEVVDQDGSVSIQFNPNIQVDATSTTKTEKDKVAIATLALNLGNNTVTFANGFNVYKTMSVTGDEGCAISGNITVPYGSTLTLGSNVVVDGTITVDNGGTLVVNGATVGAVVANGKVTVSGGSTIKSLTAYGTSTLNVSGGDITVTDISNANTASRTVTGGIWHNVNTLGQLTALLSNVNNYASYTDDDEYTNCYKVGSGSGTSSSTNGTVVNPWNSNSSTTTTTAPSSGSYTVDNFTYQISTSGDVAVWPRNGATWSSGNGNLYFYYTPNTAAAQGLTYHFYLDSSAWLISGEDYTDNLTGTMSLGKSLLGTLSEGVHTLIYVCDGQTATCTFYISGSLKAVDTDKHVINSTKSLQFYSTQPISRVWVGDVEITDNYGTYYTLSSDRKTLTLTSDFLNDRTAGNTYTLTVQTDAGSTLSSTFQVLTTAQASSSPKTGDASNLALWAAVLVLSGGAAFAIVLPRVKKNED
jgi:cytoskeletal protein CcmA (bactofilin family)